MFRVSLHPSPGSQTAFPLPMFFCPVVTVVMLESRLASCVHYPDDGRKDTRNMLRNYWLPLNH